MKFSTVALSLPLIAMVQAGVREKCDDSIIYLVYEVDDGQLERNDKKLDCNCKSERVSRPAQDCDFCTIEKSFCQDHFTLCEGVLKDQHSAIGSIVSNHQFQFDKPAQKDALHTCGWSIVEKIVLNC
ncbi:hypothetical protein FOB64_005037 [Candida albicans]|uniref:Cell wall mannoprotein PIR1-like C-terminal domain-containing protein n=1 Tax=Candida albicans TaxID=5476 RepID=A0A8H6F3H6_CANAX|nr:hypothetical protein FOB64_005037 [Candida albicans]